MSILDSFEILYALAWHLMRHYKHFLDTVYFIFRPLNMLDSFENRKGYMMAFGLAANSIVSVIFGDNKELIGKHFSDLVDGQLSQYPFLSSKLLFHHVNISHRTLK